MNRPSEQSASTVRATANCRRKNWGAESAWSCRASISFPGTAAANIAFGPRQRGERLSSDQTAALLERVGLPGYQERDVSNLWGGGAQRVSLARALASSPIALLLDETTSAHDEDSSHKIEDI